MSKKSGILILHASKYYEKQVMNQGASSVVVVVVVMMVEVVLIGSDQGQGQGLSFRI